MGVPNNGLESRSYIFLATSRSMCYVGLTELTASVSCVVRPVNITRSDYLAFYCCGKTGHAYVLSSCNNKTLFVKKLVYLPLQPRQLHSKHGLCIGYAGDRDIATDEARETL